MDENNLDELKSNLNKHHDSLSANENQGNHFVIKPPEINTPFMANAVQQAQVHDDPILQNQLGLTKNKKPINKERLIKIGAITGGIGLVILLSWIGYRWYQRSSDEKILQEAAKNLITTRDLHSKATIGIEGFSLSFNLYIDKDQDMKATASIMGEGAAELLWFPEKDNAFAGMNYGMEDDEKMEYIKLTNVKKTIEKYENEFALTDVLNPTKDFFTGENLKFVKRVGTDTIDGKKLHKFSFKPTNDFVNEKIKKASKNKELPFVLNKSDIEVFFWISNSDLKIGKIDGKVIINTESSESEKKRLEKEKQECIKEYQDNDYYDDYPSSSSPEKMCEYRGKDYYKQEFSLSWKQEFSYGFKDDINPPDDKDITESIDIFKELDENYQNDKTKISDLKEIQEALADYRRDKGYYPKKIDQLKNEDKPSDFSDYSEYTSPYMYSIPESPDDNKYEYKTEGDNIQKYELTVKLAAPEYYEDSEYIKSGTLTLTEKNTDFSPKEKIDKNDTAASSSQIKANDSKRKSDLKSIYVALTNYSDDNNGNYPASTSELTPNYMQKVPTDPTTNAAYPYAISSSGTEFELNAILENQKDDDDNNDGGNTETTYEIGDDPGLNLL